MNRAPIPDNDRERVAVLSSYRILDTPRERRFDLLQALICRVFEAEIGALSFIDRDRQWFKATHGFQCIEMPRQASLCSWTIAANKPVVVSSLDGTIELGAATASVEALAVRSYLGVPLKSACGMALGGLCLMWREERELTLRDANLLEEFASLIMHELEMRRTMCSPGEAGAVEGAVDPALDQPLTSMVGAFEAIASHVADPTVSELSQRGMAAADHLRGLLASGRGLQRH